MIKLWLAGLLFVLATPALAQPLQFTAGAPRTGALSYQFELGPGQSGKGQVRVENRSRQELTFRLYPGQAEGGSQGVLDGPLYGQPVEGVGRWLSIGEQTLTIGANGRQTVDFSVAVPEGVPPGDHVGFVFVELQPESLDRLEEQRRAELDLPESPTEDRADLHVKVSTRFALSVVVRVPGDRVVEMELGGVDKFVRQGRLGLRMRLVNRGNVYLKPQGQWLLRGPEGSVVARQDYTSWGVLLPGAEIVREALLTTDRPLVRGVYSLEIQGEYGDSRTRERAPRELKSFEAKVELTLP